jgi:hypothetical protein
MSMCLYIGQYLAPDTSKVEYVFTFFFALAGI